MNKQRRKALDAVLIKLQEAQDEIGRIHEEEGEAFNNLPESIQNGEQGQKMDEVVSELQDIEQEIADLCDRLTTVQS